ncbi:MAG: DUF433 domain-containing protein [Acidobacteria bacterium]|nr:DUF433 domain-containing protein [Acidobacteriota bacterium]
MCRLPANQYIQIRDGGRYCIAGTRIGLDVLIHDFRRGKAPEAILQAYPSIGSLGKVYGAIAFILGHPESFEAYLREQAARWNQFREAHPLPAGARTQFRRTQDELARRT